jgi:hypothetical protein
LHTQYAIRNTQYESFLLSIGKCHWRRSPHTVTLASGVGPVCDWANFVLLKIYAVAPAGLLTEPVVAR